MNDNEVKKEDNTVSKELKRKLPNAFELNLIEDPILNASSINSEDYWFLKINGNDK